MTVVTDELYTKELELIQNIISRMANNSFLLKGWSLTFIVATLLFMDSVGYHLLALFSLVVFWGLDAYYLRMERCYRELYNWVISQRPANDELLFDLRAESRFGCKVDGIRKIACSKSCIFFYGSILGAIVISLIKSLLLSEII